MVVDFDIENSGPWANSRSPPCCVISTHIHIFYQARRLSHNIHMRAWYQGWRLTLSARRLATIRIHSTTNSFVSKYTSWIDAWGFGNSVCAFDTCEGSYHPAAILPYRFNCHCVGNPTLLPRVPGLNGVWENGKGSDERTSGPLLEWGFPAVAEPCYCSNGYVWFRRICRRPAPLQVTRFRAQTLKLVMRPWIHLLNVDFCHYDGLIYHHSGLQNVRSLEALALVSPRPPYHSW